MSIVQTCSRFPGWWRDQLLAVVPASVLEGLAAIQSRYRVHVTPDGATVFGRRLTPFARVWQRLAEDGQTPGEVAARLRPWFAELGFRRRVEIAVEAEYLLCRTLDLPVAVSADLSAIAALEAGTLVPGGASTVYTGVDPASVCCVGQVLSVRQLLLRGDFIDDYVAALRAAGGLTVDVSVILDDNRPVRLYRLSDEESDAPQVTRWRTLLLTVAMALIALNVTATITMQKQAIAALDERLAAATRKAQTLRDKLDSRAAMRAAVDAVHSQATVKPRLIDVWREVTTLLPQSAWIRELSVKNRTVRIDGMSGSAAELIEVLSRSSMFFAVRFSSPVVTDLSSGTERFQIEARIAELP